MLRNKLLLGAACVAGFGVTIGGAFGQDATPAGVEQVVVTGSRLGAAGVNSPTPVTAVTAAQLSASAPGAIADALNNLPALTPAGGQASNAGSTNTAKNTLNLRNLGATRTLVLLDGARFPATQSANTVDTNIMPQALIKRVDIVTGGASASYGSDAVAGAINFVLDNHYEGIGGLLGGGVSAYGDGLEAHGAANFGQSFLSGRMHVIASVDYFDNFGSKADTRPWELTQPNLLTNTVNGVPNFYFVPQSRSVGSYTGYVIGATATGTTAAQAAATAAVIGTQFNNQGQLIPYDPGTLNNGTFQNGGDGVNTSDLNLTSRPLRRRTAFMRSEYDLADNLTAFGEYIYGHSDGEQENGEFVNSTANALTIKTDNPYLAPSTVTKLTSLGVTQLAVTKYFPESNFDYLNNDRTTTNVGIVGLNGRIFDRFDWGASGQYGYTHELTSTTNSLNLVNLKLAADVTTNPANGAPICRATLTTPSTVCVPIDVFGTANLSQGAINFVTDHNPVLYQNKTVSAEVHANGPLFDLPAGPLSGAIGLEYRRQYDIVNASALSGAKVYQLGSVSPWAGGYDVSEGFVEFGVPVLGETAISKSIEFNFAGRETFYSTTNGFSLSWKVGTVYKITDDVTFRSTVSRDIRAPNPSDLFSAGGQGTGNVTDPFRNGETDKGIKTITVGNFALRPEKGTTVTAGFAYTPDWAPGLSATIDAYDIRLAGVIAAVGAQQAINFCFQGITSYCSGIARGPTPGPSAPTNLGVITAVTSSNQNLNSLRTNGIDAEIDYAVPADDWFSWWQGTLQIRTLTNFLGIDTTVNNGALNSYGARGTQKWKNNTTFNYDLGQWSTFLQIRFIGSQKWSGTVNDTRAVPYTTSVFNQVNPATYFDFQEAYHIDPSMTLSLNIQNLFNLPPQFAPANSNYAKVTNESQYDTMGRYFRIQFRFKY